MNIAAVGILESRFFKLRNGNNLVAMAVVSIFDVLSNLFICFAVVSAPSLTSSYLVVETTRLRISSQS